MQNKTKLGLAGIAACNILWLFLTGCAATPIGLAVKAAGQIVNDEDVQSRAGKLLGQPASAADAMFGTPYDVLRANDGREWRTYPVSLDVADVSRYVVEMAGGKVVGVFKTQKYSDAAMDAVRQLAIQHEIIGADPRQCEERLKMGPPKLTVRSQRTGGLVQLYDASMVKIPGITNPEYCVARFNRRNKCDEVALTTVVAATNTTP